MRFNNNTDPASMLEQINKVEAPPFLLTRIRQKIDAAYEQRVSVKWVWAAGLSFLLIIMLNLYAVFSHEGNNHPRPGLAREINLYPQNSLYE